MDLNAVDLRLLRSFVELSRSTSFLRAAGKLGISQPALSQQMGELSAAMGIALFEKVGRRSMLTESGRRFAIAAQQVLENLDNALLEHCLAKTDISGTLRIAAINTYVHALAIPVCAALVREHPQLRVNLRELSAHDIVRELEEGGVDLGILPRMPFPKNLAAETLFTETLGIVGLSGQVKPFGSSASLSALRNKQLVMLNKSFLMRQQIDRQAVQDKVEFDFHFEVSGVHNIIATLRQGDWLSVGSGLSLLNEPALGFAPLKGRYLSREALICYRAKTPDTRSVMLLKKALHERAKELKKQLRSRGIAAIVR